ncbi:MAG TPA: hypothetical protein VE200_09265, partial [Xanthobacteraceae bacterium]|nr:hypothetical protein [Xanthobacteraceae bacterium]
VTQSFSHIVRALYFGSLSGVGDLPMWATGPAIMLAIAGTSLAPFVIERMTDHGFRQWTRLRPRVFRYWLAQTTRAIHDTSRTRSVRSL